jgi:putative membrane protein
MESVMKRQLLLAACVSAVLACSVASAQTSAGGGMQPAGDKADVSQIDRAFAIQAGSANLAEIQLGQLAAAQGSSAAVKDFGNRMVSDHTAANMALSDILNSKHIAPSSEPSMPQQKTIASLQAVSGADFDQRYARQAVIDHNDAIRLFTSEAAHGTDSELQAFAAKTLPTLKQHLQMAQTLPMGNGAM